jgi:hypothetical protein
VVIGTDCIRRCIFQLSYDHGHYGSKNVNEKQILVDSNQDNDTRVEWNLSLNVDTKYEWLIEITTLITGAWGMDFLSFSPLFSTTPPFSFVFLHLTISVDVIHHE